MANFRPPCDCCLFGELYTYKDTYMTPILIFQSISSFNPILREINFNEKNCQFIVWGHKLQEQIENFSIIYCTKSKLKGGQFVEKNANSCILGPILWAVLDILGGLPIGPQSTDLKNFEQFPTQNPNSKGVCFMQKIANSCI